MPPFHLPQNKCYGVFKYEKLNYSHRILNIPKIKFKNIYIFFFFFFFLGGGGEVGAGGKSGARADENHEC